MSKALYNDPTLDDQQGQDHVSGCNLESQPSIRVEQQAEKMMRVEYDSQEPGWTSVLRQMFANLK